MVQIHDERVPVSESRVLSAHVRAEPRSPEPDCSPSSCKDTLMPVLKSDGPRDSMKPLGAFLTLVAQHGFRNFDYSERMPRSTIYDGLRDQDGESHKKEAGHGGSLGRSPGRGSRSPRPSLPRTPLQWSSRARSSWKGVTFGLESARQLDSVPPLQDSAVLHASCRGACSLPQGGTSEQRCQGGPSGDPENAKAEDFPVDREIALSAAEVSARNQLERIQALRKGAAPKAKTKATPKMKTPEPSPSESSSPLSPGTILINDTPIIEHPGRKATRINEKTAEDQEYETR